MSEMFTSEMEVDEGSPMGGGECSESPVHMMEPQVELDEDLDHSALEPSVHLEENIAEPQVEFQEGTDHNENNVYPFDPLAPEYFADTDGAVDSTGTTAATEYNMGGLNGLSQDSGDTNATDVALNDNSLCNSVDTSIDGGMDTSNSMLDASYKEDDNTDYNEMQRTYLKDFFSSSAEECKAFPSSTADETPVDTTIERIPLSRFPSIVKVVERAEYETIQILYQLLYQRSAWDTQELLSKRILEFSGFPFNKNSEEYYNRVMLLQTLPNSVLVKIGAILCLEQVKNVLSNVGLGRHDLINAIMEFLALPKKKTRASRFRKMSDRKERYTNKEDIKWNLEELSNDPSIKSSDEDDCSCDGSLEDFVDPIDVVNLKDGADSDYMAQLSEEEESDINEFDIEKFEGEIDSAIRNSEVYKNEASQTLHVCESSGKKTKSNKKDKNEEKEKSFLISFDGDYVQGKRDKDGNAFVWETKPLSSDSIKIPERNHIAPGPVGCARDVIEPIDCFSLFMTPEMLNLIKMHTNEEIRRCRKSKSISDKTFSDIESIEELKALLGLFIYSAIKKDNHLPTSMLFNVSHCGSWYCSSMSIKRFEYLVRCLCFDDKTSQDRNCKFAPISELWNMFTANCRKHYKPGSCVTIDEQLIGFQGKCPFRMYLPNKPSKYGIKNIVMCDSSTKYMMDAIIYTGKGSTLKNESVASYFVKKLVEPIEKSNRNITFDNSFTSISLVSELLQKGLTVIGTIRKNERELPPTFTNLGYKDRRVGSSLFVYHKDMLALSYKAKINKIVTLVSSMHSTPEFHPFSKKPLVIHAYNTTKGGVDMLDQLCSTVSCSRKTKRWPMCIFYNILNIACINSYVIYKHNFYRIQKEKIVQHESAVDEQKSRGSFSLKNENNTLCMALDKTRITSIKAKDKLQYVTTRECPKRGMANKPLTRMEFMLKLNEQLSYSWKKMRLTNSVGMSKELIKIIEESIESSLKPAYPLVLPLVVDTSVDPVSEARELSASVVTDSAPGNDASPMTPLVLPLVVDTSVDPVSEGRELSASVVTDSAPGNDASPMMAVKVVNKAAKRKYCDFCPSSIKRKTSTRCSTCNRWICGSHTTRKLCGDCPVIADFAPRKNAALRTPVKVMNKAAKRKYCDFCPISIKRKTSTRCSTCNRLICGSHTTKKLCGDC